MLHTMALVAAMSITPAQGGIQITNDRLTFGGEFGPTRPDNRFLPGDLFYMAFNIEGLKQDSQGKVSYVMGMVVTDDATQKVIFESKPAEQPIILPLGAQRLPCRAFLLLGLDLKGNYTCRLTVSDKATGVSKLIEKKFIVLDPMFGIVAFHTTFDREGSLAAPLSGIAGQSLWLHFVTVGFARDPQSKQPHNQVEMRVYDLRNGQPTTGEPLVYEIKNGVKDDVSGLDWDLPLPLNQPGRYRVQLVAIDKLASNRPPYKITFDLEVKELGK
jgi:hypothetical protein